jgi:chitodextrinase
LRRRLLSFVVVLWAALAGIVVPASTASAADCVVDEILVNSCRPWLGATAGRYPQVSSSFRSQIAYHEQRIGRQVDIVHTYHPPGDMPLSADERYFISRPDTISFINWKPTVAWIDAAGGNATVNAQIDRVADAFNSVGPNKVFLTLSHEPENDVSVGHCTNPRSGARGGSPADYKAMWRNVRARFDARGVDNVVWVMNYMNWPDWDCLIDDVYPGDDLVDWIVFNGYGGPSYPNYVTNVGHFYDLLTDLSIPGRDLASKPWGIVEWSARNASEQVGTSYFNQARTALESNRFPNLKAYMAYDMVGSNGNENRVAYTGDGVYSQARMNAYAAFANSPVFSVTDSGDVTPPTAPQDLRSTSIGSTSVGLAWTGSTDDVAVTGYRVYRNGTLIGSPPGTTFTDTAASQGAALTYTVRAVDAAGNQSALSTPLTVTTPPDSVAPTVPGGVTAANSQSYLVTVNWGAATDSGGSGLAGYRVYRNGSTTPLATVGPTTRTFRDYNVTANTTYTYRVVAFDGRGNASAMSAAASDRTAARTETVAPTRPTGLRVSSVTTTSVRLAWTASTDAGVVRGYRVFRNDVYVGTSTTTTFTDAGRTRGTAYSYRVVAFDSSANLSPSSATVVGTTAP